MISKQTTKSPYALDSSIRDGLKDGFSSGVHTFQLEREDLKTVLYRPADGYGNATSYSQLIDANTELQNQLSIIDVFEPWYQITGMKYNYIINLE